MNELFHKQSSRILIYLFFLYLILLLLLTFTDMANIFANSVGLRVAFTSTGSEVSPSRVKTDSNVRPHYIGRYNFQPNLNRFVFYSIAGLLIIFIVNLIEITGDSSSKKSSNNKDENF